MWTASFWKALAERGIKTFCQTEAALLIANGTGLFDTDWGQSFSVAGMAAAISALTTVGSGLAVGQASIVKAETVAPTPPPTPADYRGPVNP